MLTNFTRLLLLCLAVFIISCQKEISIELGSFGSQPPVSAVLKMKIDGSQWIADRNAGASMIAGLINISGTSRNGKELVITLNDTVPGTYVLDQVSFGVGAISDSIDLGGLPYTTNEGVDTTQAGGMVVISAIDKVNKTISGTFRFKAYRNFDKKQKQVTEGIFDKLPYTSTLPPARITDTFHVKVANADYRAKSITGTQSGPDIYITGSEQDLSKLVALSMPSNIIPGTYNLDAVTGIYVGIYSPVQSSIMSSLSGKLTIVEHNKLTRRIRGNFDFIAIDLRTAKSTPLTAGYFSVVY